MDIADKLKAITEKLAEEIGTDIERFKAIMSKAKNIIVIVETEEATFIETNAPDPLHALEMLIGVTDYLFMEVADAAGGKVPEGDIDSESGGSDPLDKGTIN